MHKRVALVLAGIVFFGVGLTPPAQSQPATFPARPVRVIVPFAPGGGADLVARHIAGKYTEQLGQQFVIDNRGGSGGVIGMEIAANAAPDGHTLLFSSASYVATMAVRKASHDKLKTLAPVGEVGVSPYVLSVHPTLPATLSGLIELARTKPEQLSYASPGVGSLTHLATELFLSMTQVKITHVPYKGAGAAMPDLLTGRTSFLMTPPIALMSHFRAGRLRALAVTGAARMADLPDVPVVSDTVPGYLVMTWYGVFAPGGTPSAVVNTLNAALNKILAERELKKTFESQGIDATGGAVARLAQTVSGDYQRWLKVVKAANIAPD
ncbi:MAG: tripartite tricarboxylate transporter substrate binding protein [Betaproteobacteria bacterium]|nr:tripartite tricarboxylate transporter substrate binding protein [Betaproteobacteria bacterium]